MFIWSAHKKLPDDIHTEIISRVEKNYNDKKKFFTSYVFRDSRWSSIDHMDHSIGKNFHKEFPLLDDYYENIIKEMMRNLGLWSRTKYQYNLWVQMYNSETNTHHPHEHYTGGEVISFNHIIDASKEKCFYFLNDDGDKIYPGEQRSGDIFAWPPWRIHGVDKVKEPNVNRLILAGNIWLESYKKPPGS